MKKFNVEVEVTQRYIVEVEAEDSDAAEYAVQVMDITDIVCDEPKEQEVVGVETIGEL